jgi:hypothetical protein
VSNRWWGGFWAQLPLAATIAGLQTLALTADNAWIFPALATMWGVTIAPLVRPVWRERVAAPVRWLRRRPVLYWWALLLIVCGGLGIWTVIYQPTNGRALKQAEVCWLLTLLWLLLYLLLYGLSPPDARALGHKLARGRLTGPMLTLTTLVFILIGAETYLRLFHITTDSYSFTAMNYWWYQNFYFGHWNTFGYRDHEPRHSSLTQPLTRIAVVGDSFAAGQGINNLDDTFPQLLEQKLGPAYDVNLVAQSGWDTDVEEAWLNGYPLKPNIVILSYFLNDVDYLLRDTDMNPDLNFTVPRDPALAWMVLNFFLPNYFYYNVMQYTSPTRAHNFAADLVNAHLEDRFWGPQSQKLQSLINWTKRHNARLIALLWPMIDRVPESAPATGRVRAFFEARSIAVVDMTDALRDKNPAEMRVNAWDAHPGLNAHRLAADLLYAALTQSP